MTKRSILASLALAAVSLLLSPEKTDAESKPLRFLVSNGMKAAIEELQPQCETAIGTPLALQFSSTFGLKKKINAGEAFDATIITSEAVAELTRQGKLASGASAYLGRSPLGIGIRKGAAKPDIGTPAAFKQALLNAKSITYPQDGATRGFIDNMFVKMGIDAQVKPKIILAPSSGASTENVATGKAEMVITLFSEIVPVHGIEVLGPLPGEYATYVNFTVAGSAGAQNPDAVKKLIAFLSAPKTAPLLKAKGLEVR
jgi:molybdate transport system substrate-binding protein